MHKEEEEEKEVSEEGADSSARVGAGPPVPLLRDGALHGGGAPTMVVVEKQTNNHIAAVETHRRMLDKRGGEALSCEQWRGWSSHAIVWRRTTTRLAPARLLLPV